MEDSPIASNKLVLPCPFGPRKNTRFVEKDKFTSSTLRKLSRLIERSCTLKIHREITDERDASSFSSLNT